MSPFHVMPGAMSPTECADLTNLCTSAPMRDAALVGATTAHQVRRADILWLDDLPGAAWVMDRMIGIIVVANREGYGFDLTDFGESAQVARYDAARAAHFDWHADIGGGMWAMRRKLTVVVQLSDPDAYQGGALNIWSGHTPQTAPREIGTAIVFPSFHLHRVQPVTTGLRWSLTLWAHGPTFR